MSAAPTLDVAAYEHNNAPVARSRFYEIACNPQRSVAVEACAGAGKTWMLVSRMLRALVEGCAPQDILAITFTKKAAAEMRQRLQEWLKEFSTASDAELLQALQVRGMHHAPTPAQLATLRGLHTALLQGGGQMQIRTFHSWFAALVRSAPLGILQELGLPLHYDLLENDAKAVALVWRRFQTRVAQDPDASVDYRAAVATHGRHQTHKALEQALAKRVEFVLSDAHGVVDASVQHFTAQFPEFAAYQHPHDHLLTPPVQQILWQAARVLGTGNSTCIKAATEVELCLTQHNPTGLTNALFTQAGAPRVLSEKLVGIEAVRQAQDVLAHVQRASNQHAAWLHQHCMARLTRGLVEDFAALKRERGWVDMSDLERAALRLMSDPLLSGWVQERLDARVRHLLIDEFQDTNPLQWQALKAWLTGYTGAGYAPSVFVVGDPKQSIYRFRRAEPQVFKAAKDFVLHGLGGDVLSCDHTRRNAPAIIGLVNTVVLQAQDAGEFESFRSHTTESEQVGQVLKLPRLAREPKAAKSAGQPQAELQWRDSLTTPRFEAEETRSVLECRQAAQWLVQYMQAHAIAPKEVLVLSRKRERLGLMQAELASLNLAAQQPEKTELGEMPEVQDVVALLDVLVSHQHDLSLARALKSPLFSASDADLVQLVLCQRALQAQLKGADPSKDQIVSWWDVLQSAATAAPEASTLPPAFAAIGSALALYAQWAANLPPHDALSALYEHADVLAKFGAAAPAVLRDSVLANLRAVLHTALSLDGGRYTTTYALVRALRGTGNPAPVRAQAGAVRLLTVHAAKGLEAQLVLILDADGEDKASETMGVLVQWPGQDLYPRRFVFLASESKPPDCAIAALAEEKAERQREEINGLYVALTRAKQTLVVSSTQPHRQNPKSWWLRLEAHAADAPAFTASPVLAAAQPGLASGFAIEILPKMAAAPVEYAQAAIKVVADADSLDSRIGQAMHRLLEWVPVARGGASANLFANAFTPGQLAAVSAAFALTAAQAQNAAAMALAIVQGQGAWAWDTDQLQWHSNEVALSRQGRSLRIDRLVQHASTGHWWVLDYKTTSRPQTQPDLLAQLANYRASVALAYPGQTVRAAFLTAQGALIEP